TVNYAENGAWLAAQLCMGTQAVVAWGASQAVMQQIQRGDIKSADVPRYTAYWPSDNIAVVYTGITGLLNLLVIIDALARADAPPAPVLSRPPPAAPRLKVG